MGQKISIMVEGEVQCHAASTIANYVTLCGLDGDDPGIGQSRCDVLNGQKIDCQQCIQIIHAAKQYRNRELES